MYWYLAVLQKYAVFDGRARRKEYWYFVLFSTLINIILAFIDDTMGNFDDDGTGFLTVIYNLLIFIPYLAATVRRLHDTDHSGWWLLITLIPVIGAIVLFIFTLQDSQFGDNQYGRNPKE